MFKVQFRDADDHDRVLINEIRLGFDPRLSAYVRIRAKPESARADLYRVTAEDGISDVVTSDPDQSSIIVYLKEVRK